MTGRAAQHIVIAGLVSLYVAAWAASPLVLHETSDLDAFFWPSAETAAHGHPLLVYSANTLGQGSNDNGPLALLPMVPIAVVANGMGWANDVGLRAGITDAVFAVFALLLAATAVRMIGRARGGLEWRLAAPCVFLLAPALWISVGDYGHLEQPIELWLVVLAVGYASTRRSVPAGIALGLAALTRTTAVIYIVLFALLPLANRRMKSNATVMVVTAITAIVGFAPFFIADGASAAHSLITYHGDLPIGGGSFWVIARGTSLAALVQHGDAYLVLVVATLLVATTLRLRPGIADTTAGLFGLLTVVAACFPMLAKVTYPYYVLEPYVFAAIWWLARPGSALTWRVAAPLLLTGDAFLSKWGANLPFSGLGIVEGVASSGILAVVIGIILSDLLSVHGESELEAVVHRQESASASRLGEVHVRAIPES
jgi:hypothetical protein